MQLCYFDFFSCLCLCLILQRSLELATAENQSMVATLRDTAEKHSLLKEDVLLKEVN